MLQFVREIPISIRIEKTLSQRRGFLFYVAVGFSHEVDILSGMSVQLPWVDRCLEDLRAHLESLDFVTEREDLNEVFVAVYKTAKRFLEERAQSEKVTLASLSFREERGFGFGDKSGTLEYYSTHYLELLPEGASAQLNLLRIYWSLSAQAREDLAHESFKLLKPLMQKSASEIMTALTLLKNHKTIGGSRLARIENVLPSTGRILEI